MTTTTRSPVRLESLRIATPCSADWDDMKGDDLVRFCGRCEKNVYDLSALTREAAEQLVADKEGRMCVRFFRRADGTVLTSDCPVGVRRERLRQRIWNRIAGAATSAALLVGLWSGRARADLAVGDSKATATKSKSKPKLSAGRLARIKTTPDEEADPIGGIGIDEPQIVGSIAAPQPQAEPKPNVKTAPVPVTPMVGVLRAPTPTELKAAEPPRPKRFCKLPVRPRPRKLATK